MFNIITAPGMSAKDVAIVCVAVCCFLILQYLMPILEWISEKVVLVFIGSTFKLSFDDKKGGCGWLTLLFPRVGAILFALSVGYLALHTPPFPYTEIVARVLYFLFFLSMIIFSMMHGNNRMNFLFSLVFTLVWFYFFFMGCGHSVETVREYIKDVESFHIFCSFMATFSGYIVLISVHNKTHIMDTTSQIEDLNKDPSIRRDVIEGYKKDLRDREGYFKTLKCALFFVFCVGLTLSTAYPVKRESDPVKKVYIEVERKGNVTEIPMEGVFFCPLLADSGVPDRFNIENSESAKSVTTRIRVLDTNEDVGSQEECVAKRKKFKHSILEFSILGLLVGLILHSLGETKGDHTLTFFFEFRQAYCSPITFSLWLCEDAFIWLALVWVFYFPYPYAGEILLAFRVCRDWVVANGAFKRSEKEINRQTGVLRPSHKNT